MHHIEISRQWFDTASPRSLEASLPRERNIRRANDRRQQLTAVACTSSYRSQPVRIPARTVDAVVVPFQAVYEGFGKHPLHLARGERSRVLSRSSEGVESGIEVAMLRRGCPELSWQSIVEGALDDLYLHGVCESGGSLLLLLLLLYSRSMEAESDEWVSSHKLGRGSASQPQTRGRLGTE